MEWATINGYQAFFQPNTIDLPDGISLNQYGWLDCPTGTDIVLPLCECKPTDNYEIYWFSEKIVTNSSNPVRMSLEGNFHFDETIGDFNPDSWQTTAGYTVTSSKDHIWNGIAPIRTVPGEALRLRVFPSQGNNNDFYFKFIGFKIPKDFV